MSFRTCASVEWVEHDEFAEGSFFEVDDCLLCLRVDFGRQCVRMASKAVLLNNIARVETILQVTVACFCLWMLLVFAGFYQSVYLVCFAAFSGM